METPRAWKNNLKDGVITLEMVEACLYSINKRAKNYRDLARNYRHSGVPRIYVKDYKEYIKNFPVEERRKLFIVLLDQDKKEEIKNV